MRRYVTLVAGPLLVAACDPQAKRAEGHAATTVESVPLAAQVADAGVDSRINSRLDPPLDASADSEAPSAASAAYPRELTCLAHVTRGSIEPSPQGPLLKIGAHSFVWDDGKKKSDDDRFEEPDLRDIFRIPYARGPIAKIEDATQDPGRIRHEPLLRAIYGETQGQIEAQLVNFVFFGETMRVHRLALPAFERARGRLELATEKDGSLRKFFTKIGGTYNYRKIAGSFRTSAHAFGIALDLSVSYSHYWRNQPGTPQWKNLVPQAIVDAFEAEGFVWGGRWYHYDTMHFEYRPEFFPEAGGPECR